VSKIENVYCVISLFFIFCQVIFDKARACRSSERDKRESRWQEREESKERRASPISKEGGVLGTSGFVRFIRVRENEGKERAAARARQEIKREARNKRREHTRKSKG